MTRLRDYQYEAIVKFEQAQRCGIFDMATGTGKTITSLFAAKKHFEEERQQFLVIIVPFLHLIDQWTRDLKKFGIEYYLEIAYSKQHWFNKLEQLIWDYNHGFRKRVVLIGSYKSMANFDFQEKISEVKKDSFLIADECHYLGSKQSRNNQFANFSCRLGLSATPRRWWDEEGTKSIELLFGGVVYSYSMSKAIINKILTPYSYSPNIIDLNEEETINYQRLSFKIGQLMNIVERNSVQNEQLKNLILNRITIIQNAEDKKRVFLSLLEKQKDKKHTLVYCGKGQVDSIVDDIASLGIRVHRFNSEISNSKREKILEQFSDGEIEVLVAIKCLDEGVDVPSTSTAYFLSSTSNPREFVQRRGRVLRNFPGKAEARIIDFIVLPQHCEQSAKIFKSIAIKELPRFAEFSKFSRNTYEARAKVLPYLEEYQLGYLMDILPWQMYDLLKQEERRDKTL